MTDASQKFKLPSPKKMIVVRVDNEIHAKVCNLATREFRSPNQQTAQLIREALISRGELAKEES
jgi:hypothetical protein